MLKIGDKVKVTYSDGSQFIGYITGETSKMWKINYDGAGNESRILKSMDIVLMDDPKTPNIEVAEISVKVKELIKKEERSVNWQMAAFIGVSILLAITAILVGLNFLQIGSEGINFTF
jgi:hypothetical protein